MQIGNLFIQGTQAMVGNPVQGEAKEATLVDLLTARTRVVIELEVQQPDLMNKLRTLDWLIDRGKNRSRKEWLG